MKRLIDVEITKPVSVFFLPYSQKVDSSAHWEEPWKTPKHRLFHPVIEMDGEEKLFWILCFVVNWLWLRLLKAKWRIASASPSEVSTDNRRSLRCYKHMTLVCLWYLVSWGGKPSAFLVLSCHPFVSSPGR